MKKAVLFFFLSLVFLMGFLTLRSRSQEAETNQENLVPKKVKTLSAFKARQIEYALNFPALIVSDQEVIVKAKSGGQVVWLNFAAAEQVFAGEVLAKIDAAGRVDSGENNFSASQIRQQELAVAQAKKSYELAKENYREDDSDDNEIAKKIAKLQYQSAQVALQDSLNDALLTAPASGVVMEKMVVVGDTVSPGQAVAKISLSGRKKVQFFVDREVLDFVKKGKVIKVVAKEKGEELSARVSSVALEADPTSKKFKIEADFLEDQPDFFGTVATVSLGIEKKAGDGEHFFLPLSALTVGQNESYIFLLVDGKAEKKAVYPEEISGEIVKIRAELSEEAQIIVEGNKQIRQGEAVENTINEK